MAITEKAMENYKKLFNNNEFCKDDEELKEIILNFALDEAQKQDNLDEKTRQNVNVGNNKQRLLDTVTALLPYIGYPRSLNAINCINQVIPK